MTEIERSLGKLAEEINAEHRAFVGTFRKTVEHGIRAGELLAEAKAQCSHGTWLPWLEKNFEGAPRTAQEYMRLYNHRDEIRAKTRDSAHLSVSGALKELAAPKNNRHLGHEWEKAYRAWAEALGTPEESQRLDELQELDRQVCPAALLPSRLRGAFEEELTQEEMHTTFDDLIKTGGIADWETTKETHLWKRHVVREILREMPDGEDKDKFLQDLFTAGSVRPGPVDRVETQLEHLERKADEHLAAVRQACFEVAQSLVAIASGRGYKHMGYDNFVSYVKDAFAGRWVANVADELVDERGEPYNVSTMAAILFDKMPDAMLASMGIAPEDDE